MTPGDPIHGLVVCVDYAAYLAQGLSSWLAAVDTLTVVTAPHDVATLALLAERPTVATVVTSEFYAHGAAFNKGAALNIAVELTELWTRPGWLLHFDADIIPPLYLRQLLTSLPLRPNMLYGAQRRTEHGSSINDQELAGFFQLFALHDPAVAARPWFHDGWRHAGGYDTIFRRRWPLEQQMILPVHVIHQGPTGTNWWGKGNDEQMHAMIEERTRTGRVNPSEFLPGRSPLS